MTGDTLKLGAGQTLRIVASSPEALELEATWTAGRQRPPRHSHPRQDERFEVLAGQLTVELAAGPPRVLHAGDTLALPRGTVHRMWNTGPAPARALWRVTPRRRTEEMFRFLDRGTSPLRVATLLWRYRHEYRLGLWR